ncbi:MAG: hypothetical protein ACREJD_02560 [Phycisphaerales bacterium]
MTSLNAPTERDMNWGPERTSIVAILALVFALPCFIPGSGIIASLLAVFALVGISASKGRVGGTGLAIAALVLGLFGTALWTAIGYGMWQAASFFDKQIFGATAQVMTEIKDDEFDKVKLHFVQNSADRLTPEMLAEFRSAYRDKLGEFQSAPNGIRDIFESYAALGSQKNALRDPPPNTIPIPLRFEKGTALLMLEIGPGRKIKKTTDPAAPPVQLPIRNITLYGMDGNPITLIDPALLVSKPGSESKSSGKAREKDAPAEEPAEEEKSEKPAEPAPSPPKKPS